MAAPCSVDDCERTAVARGWCQRHWHRWRLNGDPVTPKPRKGAPVEHDDGTRTCNTCTGRKALTEFPLDKNASKGRRTICKTCHVAAQTARYNADPERHKGRIKAHRIANIDEVRERDRARYQRDRPKRIDLVTEALHRRRALLKGLPSEFGITVARLRRRHGDRCCYCRTVLDFQPTVGWKHEPTRATLEHVLPISRGGGHTWDNTRLACWRCNVRKNAKTVDEWQPDEVQPDRHDEQLHLWA